MRNGYASRHSPQATHLIRRLLTQLLSPSPCEGNSKLEDPVRIKDWMPFRTFQERIPGRASERSVTLASPAPGRRQRPSSIPCEALELRYRPPWPAKKAAGRRVRVSIYIPRWEPAASRTGASGRRRRSLYWLLRAPPAAVMLTAYAFVLCPRAQASLDLFHSISIRLRPSKVRGICCFAQPRSRRGRCTLGLANAPGRRTCPSSSPGLLHPEPSREQRYD